jgi:hypothetical protein
MTWIPRFLSQWRRTAADPDADLDEIPRSPPFAKGLPAASVDRLLRDQTDVLRQLRNYIPVSDEEYERLILSVVRQYAEYVHLIPASETNHHREAGGLLRHGLEVAYISARMSKGFSWDTGMFPERRQRRSVSWVLVGAIAGLLHDVGKVVSDIGITTADGTHEWVPRESTLLEWAKAVDTRRYFLRWKPNRHERHKVVWPIILPTVAGQEWEIWLNRLDGENGDILTAFYGAIGGTSTGGDLSDILAKADLESVTGHLKGRGHFPDVGLGVPVAEFLINAIRSLLKDRAIQWNTKGHPLWNLRVDNEVGVYMVWPAMAVRMVDRCRYDNIPGIPQNPDSLLHTLRDRQIVVTRDDGSVTMKLLIGDMRKPLNCVRLTNEDVLQSFPPGVVDAVVVDEEGGNERPAQPAAGPETNTKNPGLAPPEGKTAAAVNTVVPPVEGPAQNADEDAVPNGPGQKYSCPTCKQVLTDVTLGMCTWCGRAFDPALMTAAPTEEIETPASAVESPGTTCSVDIDLQSTVTVAVSADPDLMVPICQAVARLRGNVDEFFRSRGTGAEVRFPQIIEAAWPPGTESQSLRKRLVAGGVLLTQKLAYDGWTPLSDGAIQSLAPLIRFFSAPVSTNKAQAEVDQVVAARIACAGGKKIILATEEFHEVAISIRLSAGAFFNHIKASFDVTELPGKAGKAYQIALR